MEARVHSRARSCGRKDCPVLDEQSILNDIDLGIHRPKFIGMAPMCRSRPPIQHSAGRERENTRTDGDDTGTSLNGNPQRFQIFLGEGLVRILISRHHDDIGALQVGERVRDSDVRGHIDVPRSVARIVGRVVGRVESMVAAHEDPIARMPAKHMRRDADVQRVDPWHREDRDSCRAFFSGPHFRSLVPPYFRAFRAFRPT